MTESAHPGSEATQPALPVLLAPNPIQHFYRGGARIAELRGIEPVSDHQPEEWVGATVSRFGEPDVGPARTRDGALLRDLVAADPAFWLGSAHVAGRVDAADTGLLVKLLDAGQRLPVHVHPDRGFAGSHLACPYGKTEAWYVVAADADAAVHLGWTEDVDPDELARRRDAQDSAWMLARMHRIPVRPGDGILVPAGQPHAIGEGVFLVEVQEPTDFSIVLEWSVTTAGREDSHLDLGFDTAMAAVAHTALNAPAELQVHVADETTADRPLRALPEAADPFFRLDVLAPAGAEVGLPAGFAVGVVLDGQGELTTGAGTVAVPRGSTFVVPAAAGDWALRGPARVAVARPGAGWPADLAAGEGS